MPGGRLLAMLRLLRLVRVSRLGKLIRKLEAAEEDAQILNPNLVKLVKIGLILIFVAHVDACLWYWTGSPSGKSWLTNYFQCPDKCLSDMTLGSRYLASLYWAVTTMMTVGYGDITPQLTQGREMLVAILTQIIGAIAISYLIGTMLNIIVNYHPAGRRRANENSFLHEYLGYLRLKSKGSNVISVLRGIATNYMYSLDSRSVFPYGEIISRLPPSLKSAMVLVLYQKAIPRLPLLCALEVKYPKSLSLLLPLLQHARYHCGDVIYKEDLFGRELTFIITGCCVVLVEDQIVTSFFGGQHFGEVSGEFGVLQCCCPCDAIC